MATISQRQNMFSIKLNNFIFFEWKLEKTDVREDRVIQSSTFQVENRGNSCLEVTVDSGYLDLILYNPKFDSDDYCLICISDSKNAVIYSEHISMNIPNVSALNLLFTFEKKTSEIDFPVIISCTIRYNSAITVRESKPSSLKELSSDFKKILDQGINYDVVLKTGDENIKAHKVILQARSPVFNRMFNPGTSESSENTVTISDVGATAMKRLVTFLYTGAIEKSDFDEALELYYAADKYEVLSLREDCKAELLGSISAENACILFVLANRHGDNVFLEEVVQYICENYEPAINADAFDELGKDDMKLLMRLCACTLKK